MQQMPSLTELFTASVTDIEMDYKVAVLKSCLKSFRNSI